MDGSNDGNLEGLLSGDRIGYTDDKVIGPDEVIKLGSNYCIVIGDIPVNLDVITLVLDVGTDLVS